MRALLLTVVLACTAAVADDDVYFAAMDVYAQTAGPLAAWQFELTERGGTMKVVGVEQGDNAAFSDAPYYDREAVRQGLADRIVVADYSLAEARALPTGRVRLATIHLMLGKGDDADFVLDLVAAADQDGRPLDAKLSFELRAGSEQ